MKAKKYFTAYLATVMGMLVLTGCSSDRAAAPANEIRFSLDGVSDVTISYDEEPVTFYESESDQLTIIEYMTESNSSYYARIEQGGGSIKISEGGKPFFKNGFSRRVEVYLPTSYRNRLTVTTTDGDIDVSGVDLSLNELRMDSTAGTIRLSTVEAQSIHLSSTSGILDAACLSADTIKIDTTSGSFSCGRLDGAVTYTTTSGSMDVQSAIGSGSYQNSNSGALNIAYTQVTGDLTFFNKNGDIRIALPADLEFEFEGTTKDGSITTTFQEALSTQGRTTRGTVGRHPDVTVQAETKNGNIEVVQ